MRSSAAILLLAAGLAAALGATAASAAFGTTAAAGALPLATDTLQPPPSPALTIDACTPSTTATITLTWPASPSAFATGYDILRAAGSGPPTPIASVTAANRTFSETVALTSSSTYTVRATYHAWSSIESGGISITTGCT